MKAGRKTAVTAILAAVTLAAIAADMEQMYGHRGTATTTSTAYVLPGIGAKYLFTFTNKGTNDIMVAINCATNMMNTLAATTNAYIVAGSSGVNSLQLENPKPPITSFVVKTLAGTSDFVAGGR